MEHYFAGIDIGSTMTKVAIMDEGLVSWVIGPTGPEHRKLAYKVMEEALSRAGMSFANAISRQSPYCCSHPAIAFSLRALAL